MEIFTKDKQKYTIVLFSLFILGSFYLLYHCFYTAFWYDEAYTINLVRHSFAHLWHVTANDVHPPLYYILLKLYTYIFGESVVALRIFSALPVIGCMLVGCTMIRKDFGDKIALLFLLTLILLPVTQYAASEIRMYSLGMFFVLCSAIYAFRSYQSFSKLDFAKLTIVSLCAGYTHYYALIGVFFIYVIFFVLLLLQKRDKVVPFIGVGLIFVLGYLPWLINVPGQVDQVSDEYWINQSRLKDIVIYIYYPFSVELDLVATSVPLKSFVVQLFLLSILIGLLVYTVVSTLNAEEKDKSKSIFAKLSFLAFLLALGLAIGYSFLVKPVFVTRYMNPLIGLLVLSIAIHLGLLDWKKKVNRGVLVAFFAVLSFLSISRFVLQKNTNDFDQKVQNDIINFAAERTDDNTVFLYSDTRSFAIAFGNILYPNHKHYERIRLTEKYYKQYLKNFNCIPIFDFKEVDPKYKNALIIKNVDKDDSFMSVPADSIEVTQYYDIVDRANFRGHIVYQLRRKD